jgi:threonine dehydrogenase-like Zn-dependent dehydrogenase
MEVLALVPREDAMAELFQIPAECAIPLPAGSSREELLMAQQLGTVTYACRLLPNLAGKTAVVIGQGSAGLHWNRMLRRMGLARVIAMDIVPARVEGARLFGATDAFDNGTIDPVAAVSEITRGAMADLVVEASGEPETINLAPYLVKEYGRIQFFGVPHVQRFEFDYATLFRRYCVTHSTGKSSMDPDKSAFVEALDLIASGEMDVAPMITHRFPLERVEEAYHLALSREDAVLKIVIDVSDGHPAN